MRRLWFRPRNGRNVTDTCHWKRAISSDRKRQREEIDVAPVRSSDKLNPQRTPVIHRREGLFSSRPWKGRSRSPPWTPPAPPPPPWRLRPRNPLTPRPAMLTRHLTARWNSLRSESLFFKEVLRYSNNGSFQDDLSSEM